MLNIFLLLIVFVLAVMSALCAMSYFKEKNREGGHTKNDSEHFPECSVI
jgi:Na+-transporting methylmalonyl-CoA/oxaloacetate decarboxylase gamma subunit